MSDRLAALTHVLNRCTSHTVAIVVHAAVCAGVVVAVASEASSTLSIASDEHETLERSGQHLLVLNGPAGPWCDTLARSGAAASGAVTDAGTQLSPGATSIRVTRADRGALEAIDPAHTFAAGHVVTRSLWADLGPTGIGTGAVVDVWDTPPPGEGLGRTLIVTDTAAQADLPVTCYLRFDAALSARQPDGLTSAATVAAGSQVLARWELPSNLETTEPVRDWYQRPTRHLWLAAGAVAGALLGLGAAIAERRDVATLRLFGVSAATIGIATLARATLAATPALALLIAYTIAGDDETRWAASAHGLLAALTFAAAWQIVYFGGTVFSNPWKVLRYEG